MKRKRPPPTARREKPLSGSRAPSSERASNKLISGYASAGEGSGTGEEPKPKQRRLRSRRKERPGKAIPQRFNGMKSGLPAWGERWFPTVTPSGGAGGQEGELDFNAEQPPSRSPSPNSPLLSPVDLLSSSSSRNSQYLSSDFSSVEDASHLFDSSSLEGIPVFGEDFDLGRNAGSSLVNAEAPISSLRYGYDVAANATSFTPPTHAPFSNSRLAEYHSSQPNMAAPSNFADAYDHSINPAPAVHTFSDWIPPLTLEQAVEPFGSLMDPSFLSSTHELPTILANAPHGITPHLTSPVAEPSTAPLYASYGSSHSIPVHPTHFRPVSGSPQGLYPTPYDPYSPHSPSIPDASSSGSSSHSLSSYQHYSDFEHTDGISQSSVLTGSPLFVSSQGALPGSSYSSPGASRTTSLPSYRPPPHPSMSHSPVFPGSPSSVPSTYCGLPRTHSAPRSNSLPSYHSPSYNSHSSNSTLYSGSPSSISLTQEDFIGSSPAAPGAESSTSQMIPPPYTNTRSYHLHVQYPHLPVAMGPQSSVPPHPGGFVGPYPVPIPRPRPNISRTTPLPPHNQPLPLPWIPYLN